MFDGSKKRVVCIWFPRLASDHYLRARAANAPFAVIQKNQNADRLYCVSARAEEAGLARDMTLADARAFCPELITAPARPTQDARLLSMLRRWALGYCPWVGYEGGDGLVLDVTGATHLFGDEDAMVAQMSGRLTRAGFAAKLGMATSRGGAWARARFATDPLTTPLDHLPIEALRLDEKTIVGLQRLGMRRVADLRQTARAPLARRFGPTLMMRLDQLFGEMPEPIAPVEDPPHFGVRMTLPEPIGLVADMMAGCERLLEPLCAKLKRHEKGARRMMLSMRRVDQDSRDVELRLAAPLRDPARLLPLFERGISEIDAGFGIDQLRLEATLAEPLLPQQVHASVDRRTPAPDQLNDLITRIGTRIGLENVQRFLPADSHIPERSFTIAAAAYAPAERGWAAPRRRPLILFTPEHITATGKVPPARFRWRRMALTCARAIGPERLAPEWWLIDDAWQTGLRDYWRVDTREGRRLWLYYTPQNPSWYVHGEFP